MRVEVCPTVAGACARAADLIADRLRIAVAERGCASVALSGGRTPAAMFRVLASQSMVWSRIHVFQVDERMVGEADDGSNMKSIRSALSESDIPAGHIHRMPVGDASETGIAAYRELLSSVAGDPPVLDVVHLGLGEDGHTASLFAGDPGLDADGDLAVSRPCKGLRRMTLTLKALDRARMRIWLVTGAAKQDVAMRLLQRDPKIVASRVKDAGSILVMDSAAATKHE